MTEPPRRRPGRPSIREGEHSTPVQSSLPESDYTRLRAVAAHHRMSVPALVRAVLTKALGLDGRPKV
jgi:hypothetical protein